MAMPWDSLAPFLWSFWVWFMGGGDESLGVVDLATVVVLGISSFLTVQFPVAIPILG
jgi:hypothetical protein